MSGKTIVIFWLPTHRTVSVWLLGDKVMFSILTHFNGTAVHSYKLNTSRPNFCFRIIMFAIRFLNKSSAGRHSFLCGKHVFFSLKYSFEHNFYYQNKICSFYQNNIEIKIRIRMRTWFFFISTKIRTNY